MAIGRFLAEAVSEGFVFNWLQRLWRVMSLGDMAKETAGAYIKEKLDPKTLDDENLYSFIVAQATFKSPDQKKLFLQTVKRMEAEDAANTTSYIKNFRLIIAIDKIGDGTETTKDKDGKVTTKRNPGYKRPGVVILESMAEMCNTEEEFRFAILSTGAMQKAPKGTLDEFFDSTMEWFAQNVIPAAKKGRASMSATIDRMQAAATQREDEFKNRPWWKKIFFN